ncbi:MAG: hypothetical protein HYV09_14610 [Deltaproteobacteria bacterium]|nr:hypothetical protein [Deltaproteobacteria bacterium]
MSRPSGRDVVGVALVAAIARVLGAAVVAVLGFRAVSDDDFARVVIAQRFAAAPTLDPTGTSWLPLPFWTVGTVMRVFGATLEVARVVAVVSAAASGALVAAVAVAAGVRPRRAMAAAIAAAAMPWAMQLAVATVPEVPAAACAAAAAITVASSSSWLRVIGGVALFASTTSRYDAWPLSVAFAALTAIDARRAPPRDRARFAIAAAIALAGPVCWSAWQQLRYGDAFRYLRLVRSYRQALGAGPSLIERLIGYPYGVVEELREALVAGIVGAACAWSIERRTARGEACVPLGVDWRRPLGLALLQLLVLIAGDVRDGAPTHHPERALLGPATIVMFASGDAIGAWLANLRSTARRAAWSIVAGAALLSWIALRVHRSLRWYDGAPRPREVAAGRALSSYVPVGTRVLVDTRDLGGIDYGYYAVLAAFGRPREAEIDRDQDPRRPRGRSSFEDDGRLRDRLLQGGARAALVWGDDRRARAEALGGRAVAEEAPSGAEPRWAVIVFPPTP